MHCVTVPEQMALEGNLRDMGLDPSRKNGAKDRTHVNGKAQPAPMRDSHFAVTRNLCFCCSRPAEGSAVGQTDAGKR